MSNELKSTAPKPFIFVLMPFDEKFKDIYTFGIKGAADDVGTDAGRVDEQIFTEGILDRIFDQISKADVIVADMTERNPNVFYEVGYAHALGKIVLLLTQNADDIPFDLKHRQHIVYAGKIEILRNILTKKLIWAISESKKQERKDISERFLVSINGIEIPEASLSDQVPVLSGEYSFMELKVRITNDSIESSPLIKHVYLYVSNDSHARLEDILNSGFSIVDSSDGLNKQLRLDIEIPPIPPKAVENFSTAILWDKYAKNKSEELCKLRIHSPTNFYDFPFKLVSKKVD